MFRRLSHHGSLLPPDRPEYLPTFTPVIVGLAGGIVGLSVLSGATPLVSVLASVSAVCTLLPWYSAVAISALAAAGSGILLTGAASGSVQPVAIVGVVAFVSLRFRQWLLKQEWQQVAQTTLAALIQDETAQSAEQSIAAALTRLRSIAAADAAMALRQIDAVTAETLICLPGTALPSRLTSPALFAEAIAQNRCLFYPDYAAVANAAPVLLAQGVKSVAVMPLTNQVQGAILLLWYQPTRFSIHLQQYLNSVQGGLSNLLRFQDVTLRLEKLQARLVAILETIPQGIVFVDESGEQGWLNQTAAMQLGLPQGAAEPTAIAQAMTALRLRADNYQELAAQAVQFFSQPQDEIRNWQWRFHQSATVLNLSSTPVRLRHVPGRLWVLDDVTVAERREAERQQAEAALRQSEERFQLIARATNDALWDWDLSVNRVWWNEGVETLFGYASQDVDADVNWWYDHIHPDDRPRIVSGIHAVIDQGEHAWAAEYRYRRADGSYACVFDRGYVIHAADGKPLRMLGGMTDITERKQAQEELQRQNQRAQLFAEVTLKIRQSLQLQEILQATVTEVQKMLNADRVLVYRLWADGTGSGVAEAVLPELPQVLNCTFPAEVFPEEYRQLYLQGRIQSIANIEDDKEIASCLIEFVKQFQVKAKLVVPIVAQAELWGLLIAHQCHSPRQWSSFEMELMKQLADQIGIALTQSQLLEQETRQRQELARSNTELQQFAYIASHDLQEPLRMITSYLQLLERRYRGKLDADADDFIAFAVDGATRMKTLINDLLAYSRVGTHGKSFEPIDCTVVVERAIVNLKIAIAESYATVTYDALPTVVGDAGQLVQLFQNLIGNAIKFRGEAAPIVQIWAERQAQQWQFSVQDNGIGIDPQYAKRIFVIFQRLHQRSEYSGTGIGLAVCKKIVERHNGEIWVQSEPGQGSTFCFTIPDQGEPNHE
jgi:PAS domain S-box-containing protein